MTSKNQWISINAMVCNIGQITFWLHKRSIHVRLILLASFLNLPVCTSFHVMGANRMLARSQITWSTWIHLIHPIHLTHLNAPVVKWRELAGTLPYDAYLHLFHLICLKYTILLIYLICLFHLKYLIHPVVEWWDAAGALPQDAWQARLRAWVSLPSLSGRY